MNWDRFFDYARRQLNDRWRPAERLRKAAVEPLEGRTLLSGWTTIEDYAPGRTAGFLDMAADAGGSLYLAGFFVDDDGLRHGVVRQRAADAAQWTTILDVPTGRFTSAAVTAAGDLYVGGVANGGAWSVWRRRVGETDFSPADQFSGGLTDLAVDPAGRVYAVGQSENRWVVRKLDAGAETFATVDEFSSDPNHGFDTARGVGVVAGGPSAGVYVVGIGVSSVLTTPDRHLVRKSSDGGRTWSLVDDFAFDGGAGAWAVTGDLAGNVYVAGNASERAAGGGDFEPRKIVRKSADGGTTWTVDDNFAVASFTGDPHAMGVDASGNVYVVGGAFTADFAGYSFIRSNVGGRWSTVDEYQLVPGRNASGYGFAADAAGNVYAAGLATDGGRGHGWVRSMAAATSAAAALVASGAWSPGFLSALASAGLGNGGYGLSSSDDAAADVLPWTNLDRIEIRFDAPAAVQEADLMLTDAGGDAYGFGSFAYDSASHTATWILEQPLAADRLELRLGDRRWRFNALPGDADRSGAVNASDLVKVRNRVGAAAGASSGAYGVFFDLNGDGTINASDLVQVRNRVGTSLPAASLRVAPFSALRIASAERKRMDELESDLF